MKMNKGYLIISLLLLVTVGLWLLGKSEPAAVFALPLHSLGQVFGVMGLVLMAFVLLLSTRLSAIDKLFGGLGKVYQVHALLGSLSFLLVLNHPLLFFLEYISNIEIARTFVIFSSSLPYNLGVTALYLMIFSFIFIVFVKISYEKWKVTHRLLGVAFGFAGVHAILTGTDISSNVALKYWMLLVYGVGISAFFYTEVIYRYLKRKALYKIVETQKLGDIINIYMQSIKRKIKFQPGQFAYFNFIGVHGGKESHPFSISSSPADEKLRVSAKILGDFTIQLMKVRPGTLVRVSEPHGGFGEPLGSEKSDGELIWIGAGIGITPFLSMIRSLAGLPSYQKIVFYYVFSEVADAVFDGEIRDEIRFLPNVRYIPWNTSKNGRLTIRVIAEEVNLTPKTKVQICGPAGLMESFKKEFQSLGVPTSQILTEDFDML